MSICLAESIAHWLAIPVSRRLEQRVVLSADHAAVLRAKEQELRRFCDPDAVDAQAKADQGALVERMGGHAIAATLGAPGATPAPVAAGN